MTWWEYNRNADAALTLRMMGNILSRQVSYGCVYYHRLYVWLTWFCVLSVSLAHVQVRASTNVFCGPFLGRRLSR
ncbi:hypothetical protein BDW74DRAFT_143952 [Aspergillus multicolor]|uniref:uncharacterized protein n=1 Tax=Aspergillus multicolor TaxID=41759 RepID=UPI003CCCD5FF